MGFPRVYLKLFPSKRKAGTCSKELHSHVERNVLASWYVLARGTAQTLTCSAEGSSSTIWGSKPGLIPPQWYRADPLTKTGRIPSKGPSFSPPPQKLPQLSPALEGRTVSPQACSNRVAAGCKLRGPLGLYKAEDFLWILGPQLCSHVWGRDTSWREPIKVGGISFRATLGGCSGSSRHGL